MLGIWVCRSFRGPPKMESGVPFDFPVHPPNASAKTSREGSVNYPLANQPLASWQPIIQTRDLQPKGQLP